MSNGQYRVTPVVMDDHGVEILECDEQGRLKVVIDEILAGVDIKLEDSTVLAFDEELALGATGSSTTVVTLAAGVDKRVTKIVCSGELYGKVTLELDSVLISVKRMGPDRNAEWNFNNPYLIPIGSTIDVKVEQFTSGGKTSDYEATIWGY